MKKFYRAIRYCLLLSWQSSKLYTLLRLIGKALTPIIAIASTFVLKYVLDIISGASPVANSKTVLIILVGCIASLALVRILVQKLVIYAEGLHNDILQRHITVGMMDKALGADLEMFDNPTYYDKLTSVKIDSFATAHILWNVLDCISASVTFLSTSVLLGVKNPLYGFAMILAAVPSAIAGQKYTKDLYRLSLSQVTDERKKGYLYYVSTDKAYAQDIRLFHLGDMLKGRYCSLWDRLYDAKKRKVKSRTILTTILEFLPEMVIAAITLDIAFNTLAGQATIGDYSLYTGLLSQLLSSIFVLTGTISSIYENKLKMDNVESFEILQNNVKDSGSQNLSSIDSIEFSHVSFSYPGSDSKALKDLSFSIDKGEKLAVVGINGSGKTTMIKLLLRFYEVDSGEIRINNISIKQYSLASLRNSFSCYFQNSLNYGFTLRENVALSDDDQSHTEQDILDAMQESRSDDILKSAEAGLDTYLSRSFEPSGIELSGGQNQRLALARVFFRKRSAYILDEPSSNIDPEAESQLFESLELLCAGKTTLFTSHRLTNIVLADKIMVLEKGKLIELGTKEELLSNPKRFAELYKYQADKFRLD